MEIGKIQNFNTTNYQYQNRSFKSKILPNEILERGFDMAYLARDGKFVNALQNILNDGRKDTIELCVDYTKKAPIAYKKMSLKVNNIEKKKIEYNYGITQNQNFQIGDDAREVIIRYAGIKKSPKISESKIIEQIDALEDFIFNSGK